MSMPKLDPKNVTWNDHFFDDPLTPKAAYLLGLLASDGNIYRGRASHTGATTLGLIDKEHMELIAHMLGSTRPLYCNVKGRFKLWVLKLPSDHAYNRLLELGMTENKTYGLKVVIPSDHFWEFLRGFTDGDGSIDTPKPNGTQALRWRIFSHSNNRAWLELILSQIQSKLSSVSGALDEKSTQNLTTLNIAGSLQALQVLCEIYRNSEVPRLERKFEKFESYLRHIMSNYGSATRLWLLQNKSATPEFVQDLVGGIIHTTTTSVDLIQGLTYLTLPGGLPQSVIYFNLSSGFYDQALSERVSLRTMARHFSLDQSKAMILKITAQLSSRAKRRGFSRSNRSLAVVRLVEEIKLGVYDSDLESCTSVSKFLKFKLAEYGEPEADASYPENEAYTRRKQLLLDKTSQASVS